MTEQNLRYILKYKFPTRGLMMNKKQDAKVEIEPLPLWDSKPLGFHFYAERYFSAACSIEKESNYSPVPYKLCCQALELILKAYLLVKGFSIEELMGKKIGHDLMKNLCQAENNGISSIVQITEQERQELQKANKYYKGKKDFDYFNPGLICKAMQGYPDLPDLNILEQLAGRLIRNKKLKSECLEGSTQRSR